MRTYIYSAAALATRVCLVIIALVSLQIIASAQPPACVPPPSGLISWWPGEGNANDIQGPTFENGTAINGVNYVPGMVGQAFIFDGDNDHVEINMQVPSGTGELLSDPFSVDFWMYAESDPASDAYLIGKSHPDGWEGWDIRFNDSRIKVFGVNGYDGTPDIISDASVTLNTWHHISLSASETEAVLYINGVLKGTSPRSPVDWTSSWLNAGWRGSNYGVVGGFDGLIDEMEVFDRALSQSEFQSIYNAGSAGKCRSCTPAPVGLLSWYPAEDNALDSRSRNNATMQNGASFTVGKVGRGFNFDRSLNQFAQIPDSPSNSIAGQITLEAWVYPKTAGVRQIIIAKYHSLVSPTQQSYFLGLEPSGSDMVVQFVVYGDDPGGLSFTGALSTVAVPLNTFTHIVGTFDPATQTSKIYQNGIDTNAPAFPGSTPVASIFDSTAQVRIGALESSSVGTSPFDGIIDEATVYDRALSPSEIQSKVVAGSNGICSPTSTVAPTGLIGWWGGDGNVNDISSQSVNGTLLSAANYAVGNVGQGFNFNGTLNSGVTIPHHNSFNVLASGFTTEFWMKSNGGQPEDLACVIEKSHGWIDSTGWVFTAFSSTNTLHFAIGDGSSGSAGFVEVVSNAGILDGNYHHVAGTWDGGNMRLYIDGVLHGTTPMSAPANNDRGVNFGYTWGNGTPQRFFNGKLDEVSIYNRALLLAEIQSIFNAGLAGKLKTVVSTPAVRPSFKRRDTSVPRPAVFDVFVGDATISFDGSPTLGVTQEIPLSPVGLPAFPLGYTSTGLTYDVATSLTNSGSPTVCFHVPALSAQFADLRILHLENGAWSDRTNMASVSPDLCSAGLFSLSPFAIASVGPTAASVTIGGQVMTSEGQGLTKATVYLTDAEGNTQTAITGSFGYYRFEDVAAGRSYLVSVRSKRYSFDPRVVSVTDAIDNLNFTANPRK